MTTLTVQIDGSVMKVSRVAYVKAKVKQLSEFGYTGLTEPEIDSQIDALLAGKTLENGLNVIGMFMQKEIIREEAIKEKV